MSIYYHIDTWETREIDDATHAAWVAAGNPKADVWILRPPPPPPPYDPETQRPPEWISGAWFTATLTEEELAERARKVWEDTAEFWAEFTSAEAQAIATSTHPVVSELTLTLSTWRARLFSDDPRVSGGLDLLEAVGILTAERRTEILAKPTP